MLVWQVALGLWGPNWACMFTPVSLHVLDSLKSKTDLESNSLRHKNINYKNIRFPRRLRWWSDSLVIFFILHVSFFFLHAPRKLQLSFLAASSFSGLRASVYTFVDIHWRWAGLHIAIDYYMELSSEQTKRCFVT